MKQCGYLLATAILGVSAAGCMSPQGRPDYTASGALGGAATGAIIGSMAEHPGPAPLVGAAVGAVAGGLVGHGMDQAQEAHLRAQSPQTVQRLEQSQPLTVADVKALAKAGIGDDLVISQIRNSRTVYRMSTADIIDLKNSGVSEKVIDFMINTPTQAPAASVVGTEPSQRVVEQVYVAPDPYYYWVGSPWFWYWGGWGWHSGYWHGGGYGPMHSHGGYGHRR